MKKIIECEILKDKICDELETKGAFICNLCGMTSFKIK